MDEQKLESFRRHGVVRRGWVYNVSRLWINSCSCPLEATTSLINDQQTTSEARRDATDGKWSKRASL